jgi:hypothetical protein
MTQEPDAGTLFRAAYENRYTWDTSFPGYRADVKLKQGDEVYQGKITIKPDFSVEVTGIDHEEVQQSIYTQLRDIVTHRKRSSFEAAHGKNSFSLGAVDDSGATEILVTGDAMGSNYKIRGPQICQVSRVMGPMAFLIDTHEIWETPEGYLASRYDAIFRNAQTGGLLKELSFEDTFEKVGNYYLMTRQVVHSKENGTVTTTEFKYSNVRLLEPALV